jgi:hypothetical protein
MIYKNALIELLNRDIDLSSKKLKLLQSYIYDINEEQLYFAISDYGIILEELKITFLPNVGFRCININENKVGKLPICKLIEKILNNEYKKLVAESIKLIKS